MNKYHLEKIKKLGDELNIIVNSESGLIDPKSTGYLKYKKSENKSPNTLKNIAFSLIYYLSYLAIQLLSCEDVLNMDYENQHAHFSGFLMYIKNAEHTDSLNIPSNNTCNTYLSHVFGFYKYLVLTGVGKSLKVLTEKEVSHVNRVGIMFRHKVSDFSGLLKSEPHKYSDLSTDEIGTLIKNCTNRRNIALILLLIDTGMRIGEALGVNYTKDIDFDKRIIHVRLRTKNENRARAKYDEYRDVYFSEQTKEVLLQYIAEYVDLMKKTEYLFINLHGKSAGKAMDVDAVYSVFKQLERKSGIKATPHMFRHYFANERRKSGMDLLVIKDLLGHSNLETTMNYLHISSEEREKAEEAFHERNGKIFSENIFEEDTESN